MADSPILTWRVKPTLKRKLDKVAAAMDRPRSWVLTQALESYLDQQSWQVAEIKQGLAEADSGDFASADEVKAVFDKWRGRGRRKASHAR
jgi:predicted transcriptional regulator